MSISLSPFTPENLVSRDGFGSPVPRQPAHLHTQAESGAFLRDSSRFPRRRPFIYSNRHTPSGQSEFIGSRKLRTDGVNSAEGRTSQLYLYNAAPDPFFYPFSSTPYSVRAENA